MKPRKGIKRYCLKSQFLACYRLKKIFWAIDQLIRSKGSQVIALHNGNRQTDRNTNGQSFLTWASEGIRTPRRFLFGNTANPTSTRACFEDTAAVVPLELAQTLHRTKFVFYCINRANLCKKSTKNCTKTCYATKTFYRTTARLWKTQC